ncbi:response regulator transcription factor [Sediminibacterium sp.]|uniref:response regulator n=1 Tax=Sediminibacterium sp. TaxID=1917865 RepID=UPI002737637D|nr:response regulator transcription factor [Sediminibacterium sp.]MDP3394413.1 response regulator transcription factor [Sediminibacterium sp.]MDP3568248.1 response regulator transcription factor [Sediminibacterium sp.]
MRVLDLPLRILILDHHEVFADGVKHLLESQQLIDWIDQALHHKSVEETILEFQPDIILIDSVYPGLSISQLANFLKQSTANSKLIVLSSVCNDQLLLEAISVGITAYLIKTCKRQEFIDAIYAVSEGNTFYCKETTNRLRELIANGRYHPHQKNEPIQLSGKEKSILQLICSEYTSKKIADQLNMNLRTVEACRQSLQEKTGSKNSAGLILYAIRNGIVALKAS